MAAKIEVRSESVVYGEHFIEAVYDYDRTNVRIEKDLVIVEPESQRLEIRTAQKVPRVGVALVGWGGNNGSTFTAAIVSNRLGLTWQTKDGEREANWFGSLTQSSTVNVGTDANGQYVYVPMSNIVPMLHPNNIEIDGWDISSLNLEQAMQRARVLEIQLQTKLGEHLREMKPRRAIFDIGFVADNQRDRADNVLTGTKWEQIEKIREDIRDFKKKKNLDSVIVLWTANTERFCDVVEGLNDTADNLLKSIKNNEAEISPSTLFAVAAIYEGCTYINGAPQNTFVPGCLELAEQHGTFLAGDDFKSGQTKLKSVLVDFLVGAGLKPTSIVSYNHLGNNDGKNLSVPHTFRSKEISKSSVVDDMVASNSILYKPGEKPDHVVVIKYIPYVGDSKRAMDEYTSEILMGGRNTLVIHNTCEDSLLATPLILDLVVLAELCGRISFRKIGKDGQPTGDFVSFHPVLSLLSYLVKAPMVPHGAPLVNSLFRQRACIENILRACVGLRPDGATDLDQKLYEPAGRLKRTQK